MAANFKIRTSKTGEELYLYLMGDFDGSSAWELLNDMIEKSRDNTSRILINTDGLKKVHPFGKAVFINQLSNVRRLNKDIFFLGRYADKIIEHFNSALQGNTIH